MCKFYEFRAYRLLLSRISKKTTKVVILIASFWNQKQTRYALFIFFYCICGIVGLTNTFSKLYFFWDVWKLLYTPNIYVTQLNLCVVQLQAKRQKQKMLFIIVLLHQRSITSHLRRYFFKMIFKTDKSCGFFKKYIIQPQLYSLLIIYIRNLTKCINNLKVAARFD